MRKTLVLLPLMLIACGDKGDDTGTAAAAVTGDAASGEAKFASSCAGCHGADGTGGTGPDLTSGLVSDHTEAELSDIIENGTGGMPPITSEAQDVADIVAYIVEQWG